MKRLVDIVVLFCLLAVPCFLLLRAGRVAPPGTDASASMDIPLTSGLEQRLKSSIPYRGRMRQMELDLKYAGGMQEQNRIFISQNGLMRNVDPPNYDFAQANTNAVLRMAEEVGVTVYLAVIPTACAVKQQDLPRFAEIFNQKEFIEEIYNQVSGYAITCDTYPLLFSRREEYIYYRTENNLTSLGGYYLYSVLGERMGQEVRPLSEFDIEYVLDDYTGGVYETSPYKNVRPDLIELYHYNKYPRSYRVDHYNNGENNRYYTLYPRHMAGLGRQMDIYFGGVSAVVDIRTSSPYQGKLLVFGDSTATSFLPFLSIHYERITLVDTSRITSSEYDLVNLEDYDQILFAYGMETYMHYDTPSRIQYFLE